MTEYELIDLSLTWLERSEGTTITYFTVISAYLVTAYTVGKELTKRQVVVVSFLFFSFAGASTVAAIMQLESIFNLATLRSEMFAESKLPVQTGNIRFGYFFIVIQAVGIFVALNFMWDIRHPKTE